MREDSEMPGEEDPPEVFEHFWAAMRADGWDLLVRYPSFELTCSVCGTNTVYAPCDHKESFVDRVTVDEVRDSAFALLDGD